MKCTFTRLKKEDKTFYSKTFSWLKQLTREQDNEDANEFCSWVENNAAERKPFGAFVLYDNDLKDVVAILSVVKDDQGVGKEYKVKGIWVGGVNVKRELRNKGYGKELMKRLDIYFVRLAMKKPLQVNLFCSNPIALSLYEKIGFKRTGIKVRRNDKLNEILTKKYNSKPKTAADS